MKTPELLHILYSVKDKIHAHEEYRVRQHHGVISEDRVYDLVMKITGSDEMADKARSYFVLEDERAKRQ